MPNASGDAALAARLTACESHIVRLRRALGAAGGVLALGAAAILSAFAAPGRAGHTAPVDSLVVRELVVVDSTGVVRARVGGHLPDAVVQGRRIVRGDQAAGVLLYDNTGVERGGYVTFDWAGTVALTLDTRGEQAAIFGADAAEGAGATLRVWRARDWAELKADAGGPHVSVGRHAALAFLAPSPTADEEAAMCRELKAEVAQVTPPPPPAVVLDACRAHAADARARQGTRCVFARG